MLTSSVQSEELIISRQVTELRREVQFKRGNKERSVRQIIIRRWIKGENRR